MSKAAKPPAPTAPPEGASADVPFEEALQRLETIVEAMESDELPLETLLTRFAEGSRLVEVCQAKLAAAELRIQQLEKNANGDTGLQPVAAPAPNP